MLAAQLAHADNSSFVRWQIAQRASLRCGFKDNQSKNSHGMKITQFHRSLRKVTGEKIAALQVSANLFADIIAFWHFKFASRLGSRIKGAKSRV